MKKKIGRIATALLALSLAVPLGFPQSNGSGGTGGSSGNGSSSTGTGTTATGTANAGSQSNLTFNSTGGGRQFIQALPGTSMTPGPFPGYPLQSGIYEFYWVRLMSTMTMSEIEACRDKHAHAKVTVMLPDAVPENSDPVYILDWSPYGNGLHPDDQEVGVVNVVGKPGEDPEPVLCQGLFQAKKKLHTNRVAAFILIRKEGITKGRSIGFGSTGAGIAMPSADNAAIAAAGGGLWGNNRVYESDTPIFRIVALNGTPGSLTPYMEKRAPLPELSINATSPITLGESTTVTWHSEHATACIASGAWSGSMPTSGSLPETPKATGTATYGLDCTGPGGSVDGSATVTVNAAPPPIAEVAHPAPPPPSYVLPEFVVYFPFSHPYQSEMRRGPIDDNYQPDGTRLPYLTEIANMATWLNNHPACAVVIEGHTDKSGGVVYNDGLGARRSRAVYDQLVEDGVSAKQIRYASFGKHEATKEHWWKDRKVVLHVEGSSSDPNAPIQAQEH